MQGSVIKHVFKWAAAEAVEIFVVGQYSSPYSKERATMVQSLSNFFERLDRCPLFLSPEDAQLAKADGETFLEFYAGLAA